MEPGPGTRVRILAGAFDGTASSLGLPDELTYLDVHLDTGARVNLPAPATWNAFIFLLGGEVDLGGVHVAAQAAAIYDHDGDVIALEAVTGANLLYCAGPSTGPYVTRGPFIMSTRERLDDAQHRFDTGEMGWLTPSF